MYLDKYDVLFVGFKFSFYTKSMIYYNYKNFARNSLQQPDSERFGVNFKRTMRYSKRIIYSIL